MRGTPNDPKADALVVIQNGTSLCYIKCNYKKSTRIAFGCQRGVLHRPYINAYNSTIMLLEILDIEGRGQFCIFFRINRVVSNLFFSYLDFC